MKQIEVLTIISKHPKYGNIFIDSVDISNDRDERIIREVIGSRGDIILHESTKDYYLETEI